MKFELEPNSNMFNLSRFACSVEDSIAKRLLSTSPTNLPQNKDVMMGNNNVQSEGKV